MDFDILVTPNAYLDTLEGIDWYDSQSTGLGERFYNAIQKQYDILCQNPFFQIRHNNDVRCVPLDKFPYMIHFIVDEETKRIVILGVICTHRDPTNWKNLKD